MNFLCEGFQKLEPNKTCIHTDATWCTTMLHSQVVLVAMCCSSVLLVVTVEHSTTAQCNVTGKHDVRKDRKGYSKELRERKDAKSSAMTLKVTVLYWADAASKAKFLIISNSNSTFWYDYVIIAIYTVNRKKHRNVFVISSTKPSWFW